jgi:hypothetical protein
MAVVYEDIGHSVAQRMREKPVATTHLEPRAPICQQVPARPLLDIGS